MIGTNYKSGSQAFTTVGTFTFTVPPDVFLITAQCWGGGAAGSNIHDYPPMAGGGGGGFGYGSVAVVPGNTYTVVVGSGGNQYLQVKNGSPSYFNNVNIISGGGGNGQTGGGGVGSLVSNGANGGNGDSNSGTDSCFLGFNEWGVPQWAYYDYYWWNGGAGGKAGTVSGYGVGGNGGTGGNYSYGGCDQITYANYAGNGQIPGGGGGGGASTNQETYWGGSGARGQVTLTW